LSSRCQDVRRGAAALRLRACLHEQVSIAAAEDSRAPATAHQPFALSIGSNSASPSVPLLPEPKAPSSASSRTAPLPRSRSRRPTSISWTASSTRCPRSCVASTSVSSSRSEGHFGSRGVLGFSRQDGSNFSNEEQGGGPGAAPRSARRRPPAGAGPRDDLASLGEVHAALGLALSPSVRCERPRRRGKMSVRFTLGRRSVCREMAA
jgi:hypothetical protein